MATLPVERGRVECSLGQTCCFFFSSRRRHTRSLRDWSSDVCSSDLLSFQLKRKVLIKWRSTSPEFLYYLPLSGKLMDVAVHENRRGERGADPSSHRNALIYSQFVQTAMRDRKSVV